MTKHDFIFSNERRHRLTRHVAFWMACLLFYLLSFHYPIHSFKGWNLSEPSDGLQKLGGLRFFIKTLVFNSLLAVIVPQAAFTYVLLYVLVPGYFYKKRKPAITVCVVIGVLLLSFFVFASFRIMAPAGNYFFGRSKTLSGDFSYNLATYMVTRDVLTSLPIIAGSALMIKLVKRWWFKQKETEQLANEKTTAELQLLKAKVHPHFLFNTLNNIYYFTLSGSPKAPEMINKLSGLLNYIINECNQELVPLQKEISMIRDYMALEKIRYGEQMNMIIEIDNDDSEEQIAPLLLIPFVENSFKHGTSKMVAHLWVTLRITVKNRMLDFFISNSQPEEAEPQMKKGNIGLKNVKHRLQLLYPGTHALSIVSDRQSFSVNLKIQLQEFKKAISPAEDLKITSLYAMA